MKGPLLDTCALIWLVSESGRFSSEQRSELERSSQVYTSAVSCAELACLKDPGRIDLGRHWKNWFDHHTERNGIQITDISYEIISEAYSLPAPFHRDPCDRIIVGTARRHLQKSVTGDRKILDYPFVGSIA